MNVPVEQRPVRRALNPETRVRPSPGTLRWAPSTSGECGGPLTRVELGSIPRELAFGSRAVEVRLPMVDGAEAPVQVRCLRSPGFTLARTRARSSEVERLRDMEETDGSIPSVRTLDPQIGRDPGPAWSPKPGSGVRLLGDLLTQCLGSSDGRAPHAVHRPLAWQRAVDGSLPFNGDVAGSTPARGTHTAAPRMGRSATNADGEGSNPSGGASHDPGPVLRAGRRGQVTLKRVGAHASSGSKARIPGFTHCPHTAAPGMGRSATNADGEGSNPSGGAMQCPGSSDGRAHTRSFVPCLATGRRGIVTATNGEVTGSNPVRGTASRPLRSTGERRHHEPETIVRLGQGARTRPWCNW
jgi:hypothetical protein